MTVARLPGPGGQGFQWAREFPSLLGGTGLCCSGGVRDDLDALPGGDDFLCPGPGGGDFQGSAAPAADEPGGGVQDVIAQRLRLCPGEVAVHLTSATIWF
jgi:hypothetical protein